MSIKCFRLACNKVPHTTMGADKCRHAQTSADMHRADRGVILVSLLVSLSAFLNLKRKFALCELRTLDCSPSQSLSPVSLSVSHSVPVKCNVIIVIIMALFLPLWRHRHYTNACRSPHIVFPSSLKALRRFRTFHLCNMFVAHTHPHTHRHIQLTVEP